MSVTEKLFTPLLRQPATPLITYYDDATGARVELSRATAANWAAKTANWLREECDVEPGAQVAVALPAHWQTVGVLLGAWWCGARITADPAGAEVAFIAPDGAADRAATVAVVALDPLGRGLAETPGEGKLDYLNEIRVYGDSFDPWQSVSGDAPALLDSTVDDVVAAAADRAAVLGITEGARVLSTKDWAVPDGIIDGLLSILAAGGSLVQCANTDPAKLADRQASERTTVTLTS
ncbi:MAG TPA: TIGR03089 family protein [Pseudonocardiaceae bacterium]|nr:TIGR03089 family protein [Pseudonocardiaceae bacterium]